MLESEVQGDRQGNEALLRAVVEVALDPAARRVARGDQPRAGGAQVVVSGAHLRGEALVLERQRRGRARRAHQLAVVEQRRVVHDRRDRSAVTRDPGHGTAAAVAGRRQRHGVPPGVDVAARVGQPVGERERVVAQRLGQRVARAHAAEPLEQRAHGSRAREAGAHQAHQEGERHRGDHDDQHGIDDFRDLVGAERQRQHAAHAHHGHGGARPRDGRERAPLHLAERPPAADQHEAQAGEQDDRDDQADGLHDRRSRVAVPDQQQVVRAVPAVVRLRGDEHGQQRDARSRPPSPGSRPPARSPAPPGRSGRRPACARGRRSRASRGAGRACTPTPCRRCSARRGTT